MASKAKRQRWVVKTGSNLVVTGGPLLLRAWMQQVARLRKSQGVEVIWVTSGAIASAVERTGTVRRRKSLAQKQALSALGQPIVMDQYNLALNAVGIPGAQILLTHQDLTDPQRRRNFQNTLEQLLKWKAVPILNENDAVATEEIQFGDNDRLSAHVAQVAGADRLIILTDVEGLYDSNPKTHPKARLIHALPAVTDELLESLEPVAGSSRGTGGMLSKVRAAREALAHGIPTWLARGDHPEVLLRIANGETLGTRFEARRPAHKKIGSKS